MAIDYRKRKGNYEISKVEIRKRNKEDIAKAKDVKQVKNKEIVSISKGKNDIPIRYVKDEILLKFHRNVSEQEVKDILKKHKLEVSDTTLSKIGYVKAIIPDGREVKTVIKEIRQEYKLKTSEPNYIPI